MSPPETPKELPSSESSTGTVSYPLSHNQTSLWFLHQMAPESPAYNVGFVARVRSRVDVPALRRAFEALMARHPALRTAFTKRGGELVQIVHAEQPLHFERIDASQWDREALAATVSAAYKRPFNLELGPLLRVRLYSRADDDHVLLFTLHHIVCDGWSLWLLLDELRSLYPAERQADPAPLPAAVLAYPDFARWQKELLAGSKGERLWSYWRSQLAGELPVLALPTDRPRPPFQTYKGSSRPFKLSAALTEDLRRLSRAENASLYATLVAALQVLLHRYTGQEDILLGSVVVGRSRPDFARIVGDFVNPVVLRGSLTGNPTFKAFLARMRRTVLEALLHQDFPFSLLVERLQSARDPSRSPLYQVLFNFLKPQQFPEIVELWVGDESGEPVSWGGLALEPFAMPQQEGQVDLTLEMVEGRSSLYGVFKYNPDLFDAATIERMAGHFQTLLEGIVARPDRSVSELPLLTEPEQRELVVKWNETHKDDPGDRRIHRLFEEQAERTPDAVAALFEERPLSYRELNGRSNRLAHYLRTLGVGPEVPVGICMERSLEMVIGIMGILKAGGAYVPLDPAFPEERLAFILEDARISVLLTRRRLAETLPGNQARVLSLDGDWETVAPQDENNPVDSTDAGNLAYVIYTSGTTGRPKGTMIEHRSAVNYLNWINEFLIGEGIDCLPATTPPSFDASLKQLLAPLLRGDAVWLVSDAAVGQPGTLLREVVTRPKSAVNCVPSLWDAMLHDASRSDGTVSLENPVRLLLGGDRLTKSLVGRTFAAAADCRIWNLYGPTEATANAAAGEIGRGEEVTVGRPIANTQIYILGTRLQPVPVGVPGEIHVGGAGVSRGYLGRPDLTAEMFIPDPFGAQPGARLYKTGDLARYLPDGKIELLGRTDNQVKIRGFRIEPGEIETVLSGHDGVREAVVVATENHAGEKRLVAYVVPRAKAPARGELREYLRTKLPDYMVPGDFVILDALPLSPTGKVDRRALPSPDLDAAGSADSDAAPRNATEEIIAAAWCEVLGIKRIGIHADFYEFGGNSMNATKVVSRLREKLHREIPLRYVFEHPTVAELAAALAHQLGAAKRKEEL